MKYLRFDKSISVGNLISIFTIITSFVAGYFNLNSTIKATAETVSRHEGQIHQLIDNQNVAMRNLEVLTAIVRERTGRYYSLTSNFRGLMPN